MKKDERKELKIEAFDYVQESLRRYHDHQLHACLYMKGHIEAEMFRQAVIASFYDLPQLSAVYVKGSWKQNEDPESFRILVQQQEYERRKMEEFFYGTNLMTEPFQIKAVIFRTDDCDILGIVCNHMLMDAMGFKRYLYLLCELYNEQFTGNPPSLRYAGGCRDIAWVTKVKAKLRPFHRWPSRERLPIVKGGLPCFLTETVPQERVERIKRYSKVNGVTVNDYLMTAYYIAIRKVFGYSARSICCAMDLRRYEDVAVGLCNQTGNAFCTIKNSMELSFGELLKQVHAQMEDEKENAYCLSQIKRLHRVFRYLPHRAARKMIDEVISNPKIAITNLGKIEEEKLVFAGVEVEKCFLSGALKKAPNVQLAVSTYKGEMTLGINMLLTKEDKIRMTYFLQVFYVTLMEPIVK